MESRKRNIAQMNNEVEKVDLQAYNLTVDISGEIVNYMKSEVCKFFLSFFFFSKNVHIVLNN